jgi:hypothetical protein
VGNPWTPTCPACRHEWQNHRPVEVPVPSTGVWGKWLTIYRCIALTGKPGPTGETERCICEQYSYTAVRFDAAQ